MTHTTESMVTKAALEPCPFCRGQAEWASRKPYLVHCANPDCLGHHYEQDEQGGYNHSFYTEAEALSAWNTRPAPRADAALVEAAFREGYYEGGSDMVCEGRDYAVDKAWKLSEARETILAVLTTPAPAVSRDEIVAAEFANAVWEALKGDHTDLRKQAIILEAHRAILSRIQGEGE